MLPRGSLDVLETTSYAAAQVMPCLGHLISDDGSIRACWSDAKARMWRAFWANCSRNQNLPLDRRLLLLGRAVQPVFSFKCARWPVQSTIAKEVQSLQKRMVTVMMGIRMLPHETPASFRRRRARLASTHMSSGICWARVWATRWRDWDRHLARHPEHAASKLLKSRDSAWLRARRWLFAPAASSARHAWTIAAGRTDTRVAAGAVQQRWAASTDEIMARWPDLLR